MDVIIKTFLRKHRPFIRKLFKFYVYFRRGYGVYLAFAVGLLNFLTIQYRLLVQTIPFLKTLFPSFVEFSLFASVLLLGGAITLGYLDYTYGTYQEEVKAGLKTHVAWKKIFNEIADIKKELGEIRGQINKIGTDKA